MRSLIRLAGLVVLGLALIVPSAAQDAKKGKKKPKGDDDAAEKADVKGKDKKDKGDPGPKGKDGEEKPEKVVWGLVLFGKLTHMEANSQRDFTLQVTQKVAEANTGAQQALIQQQQQLLQQQQQFLRAKNIQERQNAANAYQQTQIQILKTQADLIRFKDVSTDLKLRAAENAHVRWFNPPPDYDEKGNIKRYTKQELKDLKGNTNLPGYKGEYDAVRTGQYVRVYLKKMPMPVKGAGQKGKKIEDDEAGIQARPEVVVIEIIAEPKQK